MSDLTIIFITVIVCFELDFFGVLFCKEIAECLHAKADELRAKAETIRNRNRDIKPDITPEATPDEVSDATPDKELNNVPELPAVQESGECHD